MKLVIVLCLVAVAAGRPDQRAYIVNRAYELRPDDSYDLEFETSDGLYRQQSGISYPGREPETGNYVQSGIYRFTHPDGTVTNIQYVAGDDGFVPVGDIIPRFNGRIHIDDD